MKRKLVCALLCCSFLLGGCASGGTSAKDVSQTDVKDLKKALAELKTHDEYMVRTVMDAPDGDASYLELVNDGGSYTEFPVDSEGNVTDTIQTNEDGTNNFALMDWLEKDGSMYLTRTEEDGSAGYYSLPKEYGKKMLSRNVGYFDQMVDKFTKVEKQDETLTGNIGDGEEKYTLYRCELPEEEVKNILGATSYELYETYADLKSTNKDIKKLCEFYMEDLDMSLTFSDAIVTVAVANDTLRQVTIEVGGLGTRMFVTKSFLLNGDIELREKPDFSKAEDYTTSLEELADYVANYDSYEEAIKALNNRSDMTTQEGTENTEGTEQEDTTDAEATSEVKDEGTAEATE